MYLLPKYLYHYKTFFFFHQCCSKLKLCIMPPLSFCTGIQKLLSVAPSQEVYNPNKQDTPKPEGEIDMK